MKKILSLFLAAIIILGLAGAASAAGPTYTDVPATHWAYPAIESCSTKGLIQGIGNNRFDPEGSLTRAHVAQLCYNAYYAKLPTTANANLTDVSSSAYYSAAVNWLVYCIQNNW